MSSPLDVLAVNDSDVRRTHSEGVASAVSVREVTKAFGSATHPIIALDRISVDVRPGEFLCIVGASGCGKSTLLNLVAGLDEPTAGHVQVYGSAPGGASGAGRPGLMFQDHALFPWLTVRGNITLALRLAGVPKKPARQRRWPMGLGPHRHSDEAPAEEPSTQSRHDRASDLLRMVHLKGMGGRRPHELSGGMRQRAALARALGQQTKVLLMDEPFGALDAITRDILHDELERVWLETGVTVMFVTHNVREAVRLGDRILVLSSRPGKVVAEFPVDLERPRRLDDPEVASLSSTVIDRLRQEVRRHG
jgi:NitT/TauT family transport system ATP-binding protein